MADQRHPLADLMKPGTERRSGGRTGVTMGERRPGSIVEISTWDADAPWLPAAAGVGEGPVIGRIATAPGRMLAALAPGRWLAIAQDEGLIGRIGDAMPAGQGAVVDLTHARAGVRIIGPGAEAILQKGLSFDLHAGVFPPGAIAQAGLHHMGVTVLRLDTETFDIFVMSSYATSLWDWLEDAATDTGWTVTAPIA